MYGISVFFLGDCFRAILSISCRQYTCALPVLHYYLHVYTYTADGIIMIHQLACVLIIIRSSMGRIL